MDSIDFPSSSFFSLFQYPAEKEKNSKDPFFVTQFRSVFSLHGGEGRSLFKYANAPFPDLLLSNSPSFLLFIGIPELGKEGKYVEIRESISPFY